VIADAVKQRADVLEAEELTGQHVKLQDDLNVNAMQLLRSIFSNSMLLLYGSTQNVMI
jgi:hypothetical protein